MRCPHCDRSLRIFRKSEDGTIKLRAAVVVFKDEKTIVPCPECKGEIEVPVDLRKAELPDESPPIIVRAKRRLTPPRSE